MDADMQLIGLRSKKRLLSFLSVIICVLLWSIFLPSCTAKPTDMRTLVPAETLVYLETNDLAAALQPIVDAKPFSEVAKSKPDFSSLKGVQLVVAVTGFETSEEKLTDEHSVGRVQPHFVAVADTHAWNYQAAAFAEKKLGGFVADIYDSEPTLEKSDKNGGKYFIWTAADGRKAYALVIDSIIYFGNDESAIDKCLAVKRGEADSVAKAGKVKPADPATLAYGYVSTGGIAQIANIVGLKFATETSEDSEVRSAIAGILPKLIRGTITDIAWTQSKGEQGIEDQYHVGMPAEVANVFSETMRPAENADFASLGLPTDCEVFTAYNFRDPRAAWRSVTLTLSRDLDSLSKATIAAIIPALFEPYGIKDGELFLSSVGSEMIAARYGDDDESHIVIARIRDEKTMRRSLITEMHSSRLEIGDGYIEGFKSKDGEIIADIDQGIVKFGDRQVMTTYLDFRNGFAERQNLNEIFKAANPIVALTVGNDVTTIPRIAELLSEKKADSSKKASRYSIETNFTRIGMERKTTSDFGLIGSIIAQLAQD